MPTMPTMQSGRRKNPVTFSRYNVTQIYGQDYRCNANPKRSNKNIFDKVNPLTDPGGPGCESDLRSFVNVVSLSGGGGTAAFSQLRSRSHAGLWWQQWQRHSAHN